MGCRIISCGLVGGEVGLLGDVVVGMGGIIEGVWLGMLWCVIFCNVFLCGCFMC